MTSVLSSTDPHETSIFTFEQAVEISTEYFNGDDMAASTWVRKYALRDESDQIIESTPADMFDRMAKALSSKERDHEKWFEVFRGQFDRFQKIVMQGSPMAGLGSPKTVSLSNCFVIPSPEDSIKSIFDSIYKMAQIQAYRGGVGLDISNLRPEGSRVTNAASTSSGAWSWCDMFSYVTRMIGQNGRVGALMLTIRCDHPDIMQFIKMKSDLQKVTGANVSIRITDKFMQAVVDDKEIDLYFNFNNKKYEDIKQSMRARDIWDRVTHYATTTAEPGILMWDNIINDSPADLYADLGFATISTNPCSEIPLCADDSCRLASINLTGFVKNPFLINTSPSMSAYFDWEEFEETIRIGVRILDNIIDLDKLPFKEQEVKAKNGRRIGLGTHGLADCLAKLNIRYDSDQAIEMVDEIYSFLMNKSYDASVGLAVERGPFPIWDPKRETDHQYLNKLDREVRDKMHKHGRRNIAILTCAPTGSVSVVSRTSSGVEPIFRTYYKRRVKLNNAEDRDKADYIDKTGDAWKTYTVYHPAVQQYIDIVDGNIDDLPDFFVTSDKIDWERRIEIQATMQNYIDHGIASTINLPKGTTKETVAKLYELAWKKGLKGITVYVDGSRDGVLLTEESSIYRKKAPKRPDELEAIVHVVGSNGMTYNVFLGFLHENIYEVFAVRQSVVGVGILDGVKGKIIKRASKHYDFESDTVVVKKINRHEDDELSSFTRLLSTALRHGVPLESVSEQLHKSKGFVSSMAKAINRVISQYAERVELSEPCPKCKCETTILVKGCQKCKNCDWANCG